MERSGLRGNLPKQGGRGRHGLGSKWVCVKDSATTRGARNRPGMRLILGDRASALRVNPHTLGSASYACVLLCSLYMSRL